MNQKHSVESSFSSARRSLKGKSSLTLFQRYKANPSRQLRDVLVGANTGLAEKAARHWTHKCSEAFEDLRQEGMFGLIKAVERFDPSQGNAFSSFAMPFIHGAIQHYLRDKGWGVVRPPRRTVEQYAKVKSTRRRFFEHGCELTDLEVAAGLGISAEQWRFIREAREQPCPVSLDEETDEPIEIEAVLPEVDEHSHLLERWTELAELQRDCLAEMVWAGLAPAQIAKRRGLALERVEELINAGLAALRADLGDDWDEA